MHAKLCALVLFISFVLPSALQAQAIERRETFQEMNARFDARLPNSFVVEGRVRADGDTMPNGWLVTPYEFDATAGERFAFTLRSDSFPANLTLIGPDGAFILHHRHRSYDVTALDYEIPESGRWLLLVMPYLTGNTGPFTILAQRNDAPADGLRPAPPERFARFAEEFDRAYATQVTQDDYGWSENPDSALWYYRRARAGRRAQRAPTDSTAVVDGEISRTDAYIPGRLFADVFEFDLPAAGQLTTTLHAEGYTGEVFTISPSGSWLSASEDSLQPALNDVYDAGLSTARLEQKAAPGTWTVMVATQRGAMLEAGYTAFSSFANDTLFGPYRLQVDFVDSAGQARKPALRSLSDTQLLTLRELAGLREHASTILDTARAALDNDPDAALRLYQRSVGLQRRVNDLRGLAVSHGNLAGLHLDLGRTDSALYHYRAALNLRDELNNDLMTGSVLYNIGGLHMGLGRPDSALAYARQAVALLERTGEHLTISQVQSDLGLLHERAGVKDSAQHYYEAAIISTHAALQEAEAWQEVNMGSMGVYQALPAIQQLASLHDSAQRPDSARYYYELLLKAVADLRKTGAGESVNDIETATLHNLGVALSELGDNRGGLRRLHEALKLSRKFKDIAAERDALITIGAIMSETGRADSAEIYLKRALQITRDMQDRRTEGTLLTNLAVLHQDAARPNLDRAVALFDSAASVIASVRQHAGSSENRIMIAEQRTFISARWARAWLARGDAHAALAALERGRAQELRDLMYGVRDVRPGADLKAEANELLAGPRAQGTAVLYYLPTADTLITWLALPSGELHVQRSAVADTTIGRHVAQLRVNLDVDSAAVRNTGGDLELRDPGVSAPRGTTGAYTTQLDSLAAVLLPDSLMRHVSADAEVIIVPTGVLALLPFAALPVDKLPFGVRNALRFAPSLAAVNSAQNAAHALNPADRTVAVRAALVVGNPAMPEVTLADGRVKRLSALPGAEREGESVANLLSAPLWTGQRATESSIRPAMTSAPVIHFATHGYAYASEARARSSFVAFAPDSVEDGLLTVAEVLDQPASLQADLVVLSACQTGLGDLKTAEGTVGLQWAFLARGARTVLVSLWSVSDAVTEQLMTEFYKNWTAGDSKATALQKAQQKIRTTHANPRYWAAFQLVGAQ